MTWLSRTDDSIVGRWWWTVDKASLLTLVILIVFGIVLVTAASPPVAERIGLSSFHFVYRHLIFLVPTIGFIFGASLMSKQSVWRLGSLMFGGALFLMLVTLLIGSEVKGATRWISLLGFSLQPSEFLKPAFAIVAAWVLARQQEDHNFPVIRVAIGIYTVPLILLLLQPDLGMSLVLTSIFCVQIFLAGLPMRWVVGVGTAVVVGLIAAYFTFAHVQSRIDRFLDPTTGDNYQVQKSLQAFSEGGIWGVGPGQGNVKLQLPDAHADFIFAVAGEELGLFAGLIIILLFSVVLIRGIMRIKDSQDLFVLLGVGGLLTQFMVQSLIHMGSSLQLLPAKGMTLPFLSYGGSSLLSLGIAMGMLLALTRKDYTAQLRSSQKQSLFKALTFWRKKQNEGIYGG